eukprot:CAMPEP_0114555016 /NCGR_PEP_ID=MMETSP0114-20121206/8522_1 /TAXON_ID=31324 /ORGANISM="Goniomonas sp, Strain m" /LENGTH=203 /DNA_ID=CAMNT_0001740109 /DNA_START=151 /DNA_END=762 /DNA_ORIENTATION=+
MKGLPYELVPVMPGSRKEGGSKAPEFLAMNPAGTVPVINDNGFILGESCAILTYLAQKHSWTDLYPAQLEARAKVDQFLHYHHRNTRQLTIQLFAPFARPDLGLKADRKGLDTIVSTVDAMLSRNTFVAGSQMTLADIVAYTELGQCTPQMCDIFDFTPYVHVTRWLDTMKQVPGHDEVHSMKPIPKFFAMIKQQSQEARSKL